MKKTLLTLILPLCALMLNSCSGSTVNIPSTGKPYEIFVVASKDLFAGVVGDSVRLVFEEEIDWVNQPEPLFDLYNVAPNGLNEISRRHRNLIFINSDTKSDSVSFTARQDVWVNNQIVIDIVGGSAQEVADYIGENGDTIVDYISIIEQKRMNIRARKHNDKYITEKIAEKFDFKMLIPQGYKVANEKIADFLWLTYEMPMASQGVVIYSFDKPEEGVKLNVLIERNRASALIPGPVDGSYMTTDTTTFMPESKVVGINGQEWIETRGFWRVEGDWMGGPFINYVTFDTITKQYIGIDLYVYSPSPKYPKRNYIRQLEALMLGVKIDK